MEKRRRGRPMKTRPPDLDQNMHNLSNRKVRAEFFKIYIHDLASQLMRIPPDFIKRIGGNVPTSFTLKRPKREAAWQVDTKKMDDDWYFVKGWHEFVEQNTLKDGDFMTFDLVVKSTFCVTIFSPNGCLKGVATDYIISSDDKTCEPESEESEAEVNQTDRRIVRKRKVTIGSVNDNPYFSFVMIKSNIDARSPSMTLPKQFWDKYMRKKVKKGSAAITLWVEDDSWIVNLKVVTDRVKIEGGYRKFIKDNSVKVGTSCTFQLIETNPFSFKVKFFK